MVCQVYFSCYICISLRRFHFNKCAVHCRNCNDVTPSWTIRDVVQAGYWIGSPCETSYVFDQQLFRLWDSLQKDIWQLFHQSSWRCICNESLRKGTVDFLLLCSVWFLLCLTIWYYCPTLLSSFSLAMIFAENGLHCEAVFACINTCA